MNNQQRAWCCHSNRARPTPQHPLPTAFDDVDEVLLGVRDKEKAILGHSFCGLVLIGIVRRPAWDCHEAGENVEEVPLSCGQHTTLSGV